MFLKTNNFKWLAFQVVFTCISLEFKYLCIKNKSPHCEFEAKMKNCMKWHMIEDHGETYMNVQIVDIEQKWKFTWSSTCKKSM